MPHGESVTLSLVTTDSDGTQEIINEDRFVRIITSLEKDPIHPLNYTKHSYRLLTLTY